MRFILGLLDSVGCLIHIAALLFAIAMVVVSAQNLMELL